MAWDYTQRIRHQAAGPMFRHFPLNESTGTTATDISVNGASETYTGPTLAQTPGIDGRNTPLFDGINDTIVMVQASFASGFPYSAGTIMGWYKVSGSGVWKIGRAHV